MISKEEVPRNETEELSQLRLWQIEEKGLRKQFYDADKNYLVALRLYYEMLLEKPGENEEGAAVLPEDHPERWNIVLRNRYARLIDAAHQGISLAKAAHHEQIKKRMRKTREEPFIYHPLEVMMRFIRDIVPYVIEEKKLPMNFVVTTIVAAVHDLAEDTSLEIEDIIEFLRTRADRYDSSLDQVIESGFGRSREDIKRKQLDLLRPYVLDTVRLLLRLVTNDAPFTDKDNGYARSRNRLGSGRTLEILGKLKERTLQSPSKKTGTRTNRETPLRTIQEFPETNLVPPKDQRKADALLLRLETFARSSKQERRIALVVKIEDRTHNNSQLESSEPLYQRSSLRTTVARLAAYCVLDYDSSRAPLYNSLPRLIDETIVEYERFRSSYPDLVEDADVQYQDKLKEWQRIVPRFPPPSFLQKTMEEWESAHKS